jgi:hypothetical protein
MRSACGAMRLTVVANPVAVELQVLDCLEKSGQDGQRRAQLVRNVGDEITPHRLQPLGAGDILGKKQVLLLAERHDLQRQRARMRSARLQANGLKKLGATNVLNEGGLAHEIEDRLPAVLLGIEPQMLPGSIVYTSSPGTRRPASRLRTAGPVRPCECGTITCASCLRRRNVARRCRCSIVNTSPHAPDASGGSDSRGCDAQRLSLRNSRHWRHRSHASTGAASASANRERSHACVTPLLTAEDSLRSA